MKMNAYAERILQECVVAKYPWEKEFEEDIAKIDD